MVGAKGVAAEQQALDYLKNQGLKLITRNYYCRMGEIDLVMSDREYLVFIEVRSRTSSAFGGAIESITYSKRKKIIKASSFYLLAHNIQEKYPVRFDVICIDGPEAELTWIKNAFDGNGY